MIKDQVVLLRIQEFELGREHVYMLNILDYAYKLDTKIIQFSTVGNACPLTYRHAVMERGKLL